MEAFAVRRVQTQRYQSRPGKVVVYDLMGRLVKTTRFSVEPGRNQERIDVRNLKAGSYLVRVEPPAGFISEKMVVK